MFGARFSLSLAMAKQKNSPKAPLTVEVDGPIAEAVSRILSDFADCLSTVFSSISKLVKAVTAALVRRVRKW